MNGEVQPATVVTNKRLWRIAALWRLLLLPAFVYLVFVGLTCSGPPHSYCNVTLSIVNPDVILWRLAFVVAVVIVPIPEAKMKTRFRSIAAIVLHLAAGALCAQYGVGFLLVAAGEGIIWAPGGILLMMAATGFLAAAMHAWRMHRPPPPSG